jgi:hypothetical protein
MHSTISKTWIQNLTFCFLGQWESHNDASMVETLMYDSEHPAKSCEDLNFFPELLFYF